MADQLALGIGLGIGISAGIAGEMPDADHHTIGLTLDVLSNDLMTHRSIAANARNDARRGGPVDPKRYRAMIRELRDDAAAKARIANDRLRSEGRTPLERLDQATALLRVWFFEMREDHLDGRYDCTCEPEDKCPLHRVADFLELDVKTGERRHG